MNLYTDTLKYYISTNKLKNSHHYRKTDSIAPKLTKNKPIRIWKQNKKPKKKETARTTHINQNRRIRDQPTGATTTHAKI